MTPVENRNVRSMFLTSCLAVIFGVKLLDFFQSHPVPNDRLCCTIYDIKICAFIRLMYICGFAGMNNHDVALL